MQLHEKYRPKMLDELVGQDHAIAQLKRLLDRDGFDGGNILLTGPSGSGKTSAAHAIARHLDCDDFTGIIMIESRTGTITALKYAEDSMHVSPARGAHKVCIIDEIQAITGSARDYLLGLTERLPKNRILIGTSTSPEPFDPTLASRWAHIRFQQVNQAAIIERLQHIAKEAGIEIPDAAHILDRLIVARQNNLRLCITDIVELGNLF